MIYTIGREFASGGRAVGKALAAKLEIPFYDKKILTRAAAESGICAELFEQKDEKHDWDVLFYGQASRGLSYSAGIHVPLSQRLFLAQFDAITRIAEEGPCVIVGRCADYVLRERDDLFRVFVYAGEEYRVARVMEAEGCDENKAKDMIRKNDKQRRGYYHFYADGDWGERWKYDLMLKMDRLSAEAAADLIIAASR